MLKIKSRHLTWGGPKNWEAMPKKADLWWSNPKEAEITKDQLYVRQSKPTGNAVAFEVAARGGSRSLHFEFARAFYKRNLGARKISKYHNMKPQR